jgi:hypothetical protein
MCVLKPPVVNAHIHLIFDKKLCVTVRLLPRRTCSLKEKREDKISERETRQRALISAVKE